MAYIDREIAIKTAVENYKCNNHIDAVCLVEAMESIPAADVVEVVRCKDCKHRRETLHSSYCLPAFGLKQITDLNGYCSYDERRMDDDL